MESADHISTEGGKLFCFSDEIIPTDFYNRI